MKSAVKSYKHIPETFMRIPSVTQSLALLSVLGWMVLGNADLAIAQSRGRFPQRVSAPRGLGQPRRNTTVAGGTRGIGSVPFCGQAENLGLTALTPKTDSIVYTTNSEPSLLVFVPPLPASSSGNANLTITDEAGAIVGQASLTIPSNGGLIGFAFPETLLPLESQRFYQWGLQIPCQKKVGISDPIVEGWVGYQEVSVELPADSDLNTTLETIDDLAASGFWLDALVQLSSLAESQDEAEIQAQIRPRLERLLKQEDLEDFLPYFLE